VGVRRRRPQRSLRNQPAECEHREAAVLELGLPAGWRVEVERVELVVARLPVAPVPVKLWHHDAHVLCLTRANNGQQRPHVPTLAHFVVGSNGGDTLEHLAREFEASVVGDEASKGKHAYAPVLDLCLTQPVDVILGGEQLAALC